MAYHGTTRPQQATAPLASEKPQAEVARQLERFMRSANKGDNRTELLNLSREAILVVNNDHKLVFWNRGAEQLYGWTAQEAAGRSPVELLKTDLPRPLAQIENILRSEPYWDCELKQTTKQGKRIAVASRWALWEERSQRRGVFQLDMDITRRKQVENELRILSGRLLSLRDEERRRLARDLHDSVGQMLAGAGMNLAMVQRRLSNAEPPTVQLLHNLGLLIEQSVKEVRTLSYLLHPPLLDEVGLPSALEWYVSGFCSRSQIKVELEVAPNLGRFRNELELAVFRIVQETLTNVHRHSGSATAKITLSRLPSQVRLKVEDRGKGMALPIAGDANEDKPLVGVGLSGIRERVRNLGGQMQIRTGSSGTVVEVLFPIEEASASAHS